MDTTKIEKLTGVMSETIQELEQLMGTAPRDRDSTAELIINLTSSFILSNLKRAETMYPGLAVICKIRPFFKCKLDNSVIGTGFNEKSSDFLVIV